MMKIKSLSVLIIFMFLSIASHALTTETAAVRAVEVFEKAVIGKSVAGVGNIVYSNKKIGSSYSLYVHEFLSKQLQASTVFELSDRNNLDDIMAEIKLALVGMTDGDTAPEVGMLKGLEYIITGRFTDNSTSLNLVLDLVKADTGITVSKTEYKIEKSSIPQNISVLPENYDDAMYVLDKLADITSGKKEGLEITAWNKRGEGGIYRDGDELQINFFANRDCFIKVYHIDVNKNLSLIFPNQYYSDNHVKGNQIIKIPDSRYPFKFELTSPYGSEFIKVAASTVQFENIELPFTELGTANEKILTRGLVVKAKESLSAETLFSYTILK